MGILPMAPAEGRKPFATPLLGHIVESGLPTLEDAHVVGALEDRRVGAFL
jgi:hypothetical protein